MATDMSAASEDKSELGGQVAILADDLTGALDTAGAFASAQHPIQAFWAGGSPGEGAGFALDSETRDVPVGEAEASVARLLPRLLAGGIPYKKIDSLLRGNTVAEIAVCGRCRGFGSIVVAPAFPAQGRITREGRQYAAAPSGPWRQVGPSIPEGLRERSVTSRLIKRGGRTDGGGVIVCDAETEEDLAAIVGSRANLDPPVLWCGSAGLARAVAGVHGTVELPRGVSALALIGSPHPVARQQVRRLAAMRQELVVTLDSSSDVEDAVTSLAARLAAHGRAALALALPALSRDAADALLRSVCTGIERAVAPPGLLVIGGGGTLVGFADAVGATRIETVGEWRPGIPLSRFRDGRWRGTVILSKSGAFGGEETLVEVFTAVTGRPH
jgi:D-threonate/D-erythronate kinase